MRRVRSLTLESDLRKLPHPLVVSLLLLGTLIFSFACRDTPQSAPAELTVAAASDLTPAFEEIGREFEAANRVKVVFVFGSTGLLTRQIENGAPFDVFAAANVSYIDQLEKMGFIVPDTKRIYARGRITMWTTANSALKIEKIEDLAQPAVERIAIANPDHAPYGLAAREALETARMWQTVQPKLVYADNIRQTLQYAETGNVEVAILALSLSVQSKGRWVLIPEELHKPIDQGMGVIKSTKNEPAARAFAEFVTGEKGREILRRYGFAFP
ncbi:MAG TPA: molybdate ABC transporter substrate-binding protein [Pyrinomonadaceae bacterium]|nr:molybdate ABC transporter substrate-binding protein [Pyrinomonadaceae bacterium]